MMLSLRTPPGGKVRLRGAEGAVWRNMRDTYTYIYNYE